LLAWQSGSPRPFQGGGVRDDFNPLTLLIVTPHLHPLPLARGEAERRSLMSASLCSSSGGSSAGLLSSGFNHGRPNWSYRFQFCTSRRGRTGCALLRNMRFSFHRRGGGRDNWACRCDSLRARPACSGWLRNGSFTSSLARKRSRRAHLLKRRRHGFLFAGLGFDSCRRRRFRRGFLRLRRRRCFPGSFRFCFMRNDYFLRLHLPDEGKAAQ